MALLATSRQKRGGWRHESYSEQIRTVCHQPVPKCLCNFQVKSQVSCELNSKCKDLTSQCESKAQGKKSFPGFQDVPRLQSKVALVSISFQFPRVSVQVAHRTGVWYPRGDVFSMGVVQFGCTEVDMWKNRSISKNQFVEC